MKRNPMHELRAPSDLFQQIERRVLAEPHHLSMHHYHELDGAEVEHLGDIKDNGCSHCLFGWVVVMTVGACELESAGADTMDLANAILISSSRLPIPRALAFSDEASALKIIRGRAAEERAAERTRAYGPS